MVIKCPRCSSRYKIDAAGLPEEGTYARCHKCENVFFVRKRSREEVSRIRKSMRKRDDGGVRPPAARGTPRLAEPVTATTKGAVGGETGFSAQPEIAAVPETPAQEIGFDERIETGESDTGEPDIESLLEAYAPESPETEDTPEPMSGSVADAFAGESVPAQMEQKPAAVEPEDVEEPPLNLSPDDIEALLAANSPVNRTKADEPTSLPAQDEIDNLLSLHTPKPDKTLVITPPPAKTAPVKKQESSSSVSQDDIEALLSANAPKPAVEPMIAKKQESSSVSQDDIEALLSANAPKPAVETAPTKKQESSSAISQDDIEALLSANAPKPAVETAPAKKQESSAISQDDIEALLSANAPKPAVETAPAKKQESSAISQDDIEALLSANAPKPATETVIAKKQESSSVSQDDIEALLSANAPKPAVETGGGRKETPAAKAPPSPSQKEVTSGFDQDSIDALFSANAPGKDEAQTTATPTPTVTAVSRQDDIDSLLAANSPLTQSSRPTASGGQDEIDALLASAMGKPASKPAAQTPTPPKDAGEILSQSDLDSLLSQATKPKETVKPSEPKEDTGIISQSDIDSILDSAGFNEPEQAPVEAAGKPKDDGLLSQDTLDSLLAEASQGGAEEPAETMAPAAGEPADDELERLLSGEEDTLGEALFQDGSKAVSSTGEPSLDDMLAGELTPREPDQTKGHEEDDLAGAMQGVFARGEASFPSIDEEAEEEAHVKKKAFNLSALLAPIVSALKKTMGKIPLPKFKFIGAIFHKLPPRLAGVTAGLALAVVVGSVVGGWWFFKGEETKETTQVALKEPDQKPVAKLEAPQPAKQETHPAEPAPVPAKAPVAAQPAPQAPAPEPVVASAKASKAKYPVSFVVYLPVEFDAESTKILNMNVELFFESETVAKLVRERLFFSAVTVEKEIDGFFRDKFYEETVFAQDKLEEFLAQNLKTVKQFAGLQDVRLSGFSID